MSGQHHHQVVLARHPHRTGRDCGEVRIAYVVHDQPDDGCAGASQRLGGPCEA